MRRILIADDEANMRWVLERTLSKAGYDVETAEDGQLAFDQALAERPDLVLVDLKMPKLDGLSVLRKLKEHYSDGLSVFNTPSTKEKCPCPFVLPSEGVSLEKIEKSFLQQAMEQTGGNQSQAAKRLGLSRHAFLYRLEKYGIDPTGGFELSRII